MKKVIIAYDGSEGATLALNDLYRAGLPDDTEARVLTIADVWLPPLPSETTSLLPDPHAERLAQAHSHGTEVLREAEKTAVQGAQLLHQRFPHWTIGSRALADSPAWGIISEARRWGADMVVVGSHGRTPLERFFLGSVSSKVAAEAACSVRIVRPRQHAEERHPRIVVAVDGSDDSRNAVDEVLNRRWRRGTELEFVTVIDPKLKTAIFGAKDSGSGAGVERVEDWIDPYFKSVSERLQKTEWQSRFHIFEGDPKSKLLHHAASVNADSIFLGARGLQHGDRLYLGTLASAICTRAHCTVEVVRPVPKKAE